MAPRGRPKKVGLKRMDAAVDALRPLGFSKGVVRRTVNALLKVYDGNEGWVFIEEASYKLLIETILDEQQKAGENAGKDETCESGKEERKIAEPFAEESANEVTGVKEMSTAPGVIGLITERGLQEDISCRDADSERHGLRLEQISTRVRIDGGTARSHVQPVVTPVIRRRKPCYGWISDDDEDEEEGTKTALVVCQKAERKSRWDVKPEDM